MHRFKKKIAAALVGMVLIMTIGCITIPKEERAHIGSSYAKSLTHLETNAEFHPAHITALDGRVWDGGHIRCGPHTVRIQVTWSNWFQDETDIEIEAVAGKRYIVYAIELKPDQDSSSVIIKQKSYAKEMAESLLEGAAQGLAPLFIPFVLVGLAERVSKMGRSRPFEGCCFIWIEDIVSRDIVAGNRPGKDLR